MNRIKEAGGLVLVAFICLTTQAEAQDKGLASVQADSLSKRLGTFWSLQHTNAPPLPFNMFGVPIIRLGEGCYLMDDRSVDYSTLQKEHDATEALMLPLVGPQLGGFGERDPNGLYLDIESWPNDGKHISFNATSGLVYAVEQSPDLVNWSNYQTIVANNTNGSFFLYDEGNGFFRVRKLDDRIQFPDWDDWV